MKRTYAHYLIESSVVIKNLNVHHGEQIPVNEAQARPLTKLAKYFETKVAPETLTMKASRMRSVTFVTPDTTIENDTEKEGIQDNQVQKSYGGKRSGAGRKPKALS